MKISRPTGIGLYAGTLIIIFSYSIYRLRGNFENELQYVTYAMYIATVILGQYVLFKSTKGPVPFRTFFLEGFRIFIVITLMMVVFTWMFLKTHPELRDQMMMYFREDLLKAGNRTPDQIDAEVLQAKDKFLTFFTSVAIFGYLMIGALGSLIGGLLFTARSAGRTGNSSDI